MTGHSNHPSRRKILSGAVALGAGALAAANGLPAFGQATTAPELDLPVGSAGKLTVIHRTEYFEAAQTFFRDTVVEFASSRGAELDISTTNPEAFGDFMGKMTAAVRAGNPPDLSYTGNPNIEQMTLLDLVEDHTEVVEEAIRRYGPLMAGISAEKFGKIDGKWRSIPFLAGTTAYFWRNDKLREKGIDPASLTTWDACRDAALAISDPNNNFWGWGITPNRSGDGFGAMMSMVNAFNGSFTDPSGQKVTFNSPETVAAFSWLGETYDRNGKYADMLPPGIEAWNDSGNNEAYLSGIVGFTTNAYSIYAQAKRDENPVFPNTLILRAPTANDGRNMDGGTTSGWLTIFKSAPNAELAKELALELLNPANFNRMSSIASGLMMPAYEGLWTPDLLAADPNFATIKEQVSVPDPHIGSSWPASPNAALTSIRAEGVVEMTAANVISGRLTAAEAVEDAHNKIVEIFELGGIPQA
jgi:multiple sugar transport system substrate-binding protein